MAKRRPDAAIRGTELEAMRAVLYAPLPPRRARKPRIRWTRARAVAALRTLEEQPSLQPWIRRRPRGMPAARTLARLFGSWNAAMEAAGWQPRYARSLPANRDDEQTAQLQARVDAGETVTVIARELGVTPQGLGRRLARFRARDPGEHREPRNANRPPAQALNRRHVVVLQLLETGHTHARVAVRFGVTERRIYEIEAEARALGARPTRATLTAAQRGALDVLAAVTSATPARATSLERATVNPSAAGSLVKLGFARALGDGTGPAWGFEITRAGKELA